MNHAFIIQVHNYPEQLKEIIDLLHAENHYFFINVDKKVDDHPFKEALKGYSNIFFTSGKERTNVNHAGFSQIRCTLRLLRMARSMNMDYYHSLSGQDFPCVNNKPFDDFFESCDSKSYMHYDSPEEAKAWAKDKYPNRYRRYYAYDMPGGNCKPVKIVIRVLNKFFSFLPQRSEINNVAAGWSWFSWHKQVVDYVLKYLNDTPKFLNRFKYTACCDEVIFHTMLNDLDKKLNIEKYNCLRFIEWHPHRAFKTLPLVLNQSEYKEIIDSGFFFCRKIHPTESQQLKLMLKEYIHDLDSPHSSYGQKFE